VSLLLAGASFQNPALTRPLMASIRQSSFPASTAARNTSSVDRLAELSVHKRKRRASFRVYQVIAKAVVLAEAVLAHMIRPAAVTRRSLANLEERFGHHPWLSAKMAQLRRAVKTDLALSRRANNEVDEQLEILMPDNDVQPWEYAVTGPYQVARQREFRRPGRDPQ
jgi:hypothetical protein